MSRRRILNIQAARKRRLRQLARQDLLNFEHLEHGLRYRTLMPATDWWVAWAWWNHNGRQPVPSDAEDTVTVEWMPVVAWASLTTENRSIDEDERVVPLVVDEHAGTPALCPVQLWNVAQPTTSRWVCIARRSGRIRPDKRHCSGRPRRRGMTSASKSARGRPSWRRMPRRERSWRGGRPSREHHGSVGHLLGDRLLPGVRDRVRGPARLPPGVGARIRRPPGPRLPRHLGLPARPLLVGGGATSCAGL
jgi:hypothetical protein